MLFFALPPMNKYSPQDLEIWQIHLPHNVRVFRGSFARGNQSEVHVQYVLSMYVCLCVSHLGALL